MLKVFPTEKTTDYITGKIKIIKMVLRKLERYTYKRFYGVVYEPLNKYVAGTVKK